MVPLDNYSLHHGCLKWFTLSYSHLQTQNICFYTKIDVGQLQGGCLWSNTWVRAPLVLNLKGEQGIKVIVFGKKWKERKKNNKRRDQTKCLGPIEAF